MNPHPHNIRQFAGFDRFAGTPLLSWEVQQNFKTTACTTINRAKLHTMALTMKLFLRTPTDEGRPSCNR